VTLGFSTQIGKRAGPTYEALGTDLKLKIERLGMDTEYAVNYSMTGVGVSRSLYIEPYYTFFNEKLLIYIAADYLDNPLGGLIGVTGTLSDPFQKWLLGGGINWLPYQFTRFRLGFLFNDYPGSTASLSGANPNYCSLDLSAGVEF
jgi:hypothetical protein